MLIGATLANLHPQAAILLDASLLIGVRGLRSLGRRLSGWPKGIHGGAPHPSINTESSKNSYMLRAD